jgi:DNA invertase Pin-like site-specific DNA recombinase
VLNDYGCGHGTDDQAKPASIPFSDTFRSLMKTITCLSQKFVAKRGMKYGYARISTVDQNASSQTDALIAAGCDKIVSEQISGASAKRPILDKLLATLQSGDVLTVWRLDRLGRSLRHLIETVLKLEWEGAHFQSLTEGIDTTTAQGRLTFHLMGAMAEFERSLMVERTKAGLKSARLRGAKIGRPKALTAAQIKHASKLIDAGERPAEVARSLGVARSTLYRSIAYYSNTRTG